MMRIEPLSIASIRLLALRIAVVITDAFLLLFALFVLLLAWPLPVVITYAVCIALFCIINLWVVYQTWVLPASPIRWKPLAHALSLGLPLIYLRGTLDSRVASGPELTALFIVSVPSFLNWSAIEMAPR